MIKTVISTYGEYIGDVGSLYAWRDGWKELNKGEELMPWQGFIYKSFSADRIIIDGRGMDIGMSTERKHDIATIPMQSDEWTIDILSLIHI